MRAAGTELAAANARALVSDWIATHGGRISGVAWEPATTAKRIIAWLQHSSVVLQGAEFPFYRAFLKSLAMQIRYLRSVVQEMPDGKDRLRARIALAFAALVAAGAGLGAAQRDAQPRRGARPPDPARRRPYLAQSADRDGTARRPPAAAPHLRQPGRDAAGSADQRGRPHAAGAALLPPSRTGRWPASTAWARRSTTASPRSCAMTTPSGAPLLHAPHSGYERLSMGDTTVIADTGLPPPIDVSNAAHAGCLSFEMSSGRQHFIVNCGVDTYGAADFRPLARATAAHSTATLNDTSSARFNHSITGQRHGRPAADRRTAATCHASAPIGRGAQGFIASHDGYVAALRPLSRARAVAVGGRQRAGRHRPLPALRRRERRATTAATS